MCINGIYGRTNVFYNGGKEIFFKNKHEWMLWKFKLLLENLWNWGTEINQTGLVFMEYGEARYLYHFVHGMQKHFILNRTLRDLSASVCKRLIGTSIGWPCVLKDVAAAGIPRAICSILEKHFFSFFYTIVDAFWHVGTTVQCVYPSDLCHQCSSVPVHICVWRDWTRCVWAVVPVSVFHLHFFPGVFE